MGTLGRRLVRGLAIGVVAGVSAACAAGSPDGQPASATAVPMATSAVVGPVSRQAATVRHVEAVLAQTPTFPGATRLSTAPQSDLADPTDVSRPPTFVQRTGWWTSPMTADAFHQWLVGHIPASWTPYGGDSLGAAGSHGFSLQFGAGPRTDSVWTYSAANVFWEQSPSGLVIRVSAQADWVAEKLGTERIPDDVASVDARVLIRAPQFITTATVPPTVHRRITGANVVALRELVNSLNPWTDTGLHGCLATLGMTDVIVFSSGSTRITLTTHDGGCTGTDFVVNGKTLPPLEDSVLHPALVKMLGLPDDYLSMW